MSLSGAESDMKTTLAAAMAACAIAVAPAAQASELIHIEGGPITLVPGDFELTFDSAGGAAAVKFQIIGFNTLDGANVSNDLQDIFSLRLNGIEVLRGAWDLGGGGQNIVFLADRGAQITPHTPGFGLGGTVDINTPLNLAAGTNTLTFAYATTMPQPRSDESWALGAATVDGPAVAAGGVPEPAAWALMLLGFGGMGAALRRRGPMLQK